MDGVVSEAFSKENERKPSKARTRKEGKPIEEEEFGALKNRKEPVWMEHNKQRRWYEMRRAQTVTGYNLSFKSQKTIDLVGILSRVG